MSEVIFDGSNKLLCRSAGGETGEHPLLCRDTGDPATGFPLLYSAGYARITPDARWRKSIGGHPTGYATFTAARAWLSANIESGLDAEPWTSDSSATGYGHYSVVYTQSSGMLSYTVGMFAARFQLPSQAQYATLGRIVYGNVTSIVVGAHRSPPCLGWTFSDDASPLAALSDVYALTRIAVVNGQNTYDGLGIPVDFSKAYFWLYGFIDPYSPPDADAPYDTSSIYGRNSGNIYCYT